MQGDYSRPRWYTKEKQKNRVQIRSRLIMMQPLLLDFDSSSLALKHIGWISGQCNYLFIIFSHLILRKPRPSWNAWQTSGHFGRSMCGPSTVWRSLLTGCIKSTRISLWISCLAAAQALRNPAMSVFKHITNQCFLEDVVETTLTQIDGGEGVTFDSRLPTLRNASVRWLWKAYETLNRTELVQKVSDGERFRTEYFAYWDVRLFVFASPRSGTCLMKN